MNGRTLIGSCALLTALGCAESDPAWQGTREVFPNGMVRVTNPAGEMWSYMSRWRLEPALRLGRMDGDRQYVFGNTADLEVGSDGRIYVLDRRHNELRSFDSEGRHLATSGRAGGGPGEFVTAFGLEWLPRDRLLVADGAAGSDMARRRGAT